MATLLGTRLCIQHQGNHSHYATHNCAICTAKELDVAISKLHKAGSSKDRKSAWKLVKAAQANFKLKIKVMPK